MPLRAPLKPPSSALGMTPSLRALGTTTPAAAPLNQLNPSLAPLPRAPWNLDGTLGGPVPMTALRPPAIPPRVPRPAEPLPRRPYQNTPDSLMGFRRSGENRGYEEQRYSYELEVAVDFGNGDVMIDHIKGLNLPHALERAHRNWGAVSITPLQGRRLPRPTGPTS